MKCHTCGSDAHADVTSFGAFLEAGYHSKRDTSRFIWLHPDHRPPGEPDYCDGCVDRMIADRKIEFVYSGLGESSRRLSEEALREVFANQAQTTFEKWRMTFPHWEPINPPGEDRQDEVIKLRTLMTRDETFRTSGSFTFPHGGNDGDVAFEIGHAHAIAAACMNAVADDPDFRIAAAAWTDARLKFWAQIERTESELEEALETTREELTEKTRGTLSARISGLAYDLRNNVRWNLFRR